MESILDAAACFNAVLEEAVLLGPLWTSLVAAVVVIVVVVVVVVSPRPVLLPAAGPVVVLRAGPIATPPRPRAAR